MRWFVDLVADHDVLALTVSHALMLAVGFVLALAYAHGSESRHDRKAREHKRIIRDIKASRASLPRDQR